MFHPPFRSPRIQVAGLYHFARLLDKMRLYFAGELPEEYHANFGLYGMRSGLDGTLCDFLGVDLSALGERVKQGGTDEEIAEWCFQQGLRPNRVQTHVWNEFARKFGWNDGATNFLTKVKAEDGMQARLDILTVFDSVDLREGHQHALPVGTGTFVKGSATQILCGH